MNNKQLAKLIAAGSHGASDIITARLIIALRRHKQDEVILRELSEEASVAYQTLWGRVARANLKPSGYLLTPSGQKMNKYSRGELLGMLGANPTPCEH